MSQLASDAKISSAMAALGMTAPLPNLDDSQVLKAILVALGNVVPGGGGGTGDVVGPASSTDGAVVLWDGVTGKLIKNSAAFITGSGTLAFGGGGPFTLTVPSTGTVALLGIAQTFTANQAITGSLTVQDGTRTNFLASASTIQIGWYSSWGVGTSTIEWNGQYGPGYWTQGGGNNWRLSGGLGSGGGYLSIDLYGANTVYLTNRASDHLGLGFASATPIAQTLSGAEGSGSDITGGTLNIGTRGTGAGTGGVINFQSHAAGSTGTALGTLVNVFSIIGPGVVRITGIPTSAAGLSSGDIYSNAGVLTIVP